MGAIIETITKIVDDRDGMELPEGTKPVRLSYGGWDWDLYLSKENKELLESVIREFTDNTEPVVDKRKGTRKVNLETYGHSADLVREWGVANGLAKPKGRIPQKAYTEYHAAQS